MLIYRIYHIESGKSYIGQTVHSSFNYRYSGGRWWDMTDNPILKSAYAKYGPQAFKVEILRSNVESLEELNKLEEEFAEQYNAYAPNGYNLRGCGDNRRLLPHQIEIIRKRKAKTYILRKVDTWELIEIDNLKAFCRAQGITSGSMYNMIHEKLGIIVAHGYCLPKRTREEVANRACRRYKDISVPLVHDDGREVTVKSLALFAKEHDLEMGSLVKMINREMLFYRGWRLKERVGESKTTEAEFSLVSPDGVVFTGKGIKKFCQEHKLCYRGISKVQSKDRLHWHGWRLPTTSVEEVEKHRRRASEKNNIR